MTVYQGPELRAHSLEKHIEKKEAERQRIKAAKKLVDQRFLQRKAVYRDNQPEVYDEGSILSKITRQGDYDGATLVGEIMATMLIHLFQTLFATQYLIQQREFSEAQQLDRAKENMIAQGHATDDDIRLAYEPERDPITGMLKQDAAGNQVWPKVYPVVNGQVDYHREPNIDGTASRYAIRMNGFVPKEDFKEAYEIQMLKLQKDFGGSSGLSNAERAKLHIFAEEGRKKAKKGIKDDANSARAAGMNRPVPGGEAPKRHRYTG